MFGKKRKVWAFMFAFLFTLMAMTPVAAAEAVDYSYIRVFLETMGTPTSVTFVVNGSYLIEEVPALSLVRGATYTLSVNNGQLQLTYGDTRVLLGGSATFVRCASPNEVNWMTSTTRRSDGGITRATSRSHTQTDTSKPSADCSSKHIWSASWHMK